MKTRKHWQLQIRHCCLFLAGILWVSILQAQTTFYNYTGFIQTYIVPPSVTSLTIETYGAQGKSAQSGYLGGYGAKMMGTFAVNPGDQLLILVGGEGTWPGYGSGGGGGGTFVVKIDPSAPDIITAGPYAGMKVQPLIIAGGGGGTRAAAAANGNPGVFTINATTGSCSNLIGGGLPSASTPGTGGSAPCLSWGSGGGGFRTNGANDGTLGTGGASFLNGGTGGAMNCGSGGIYGGYGGGGSGGGCYGGGGGGGYTGGDGGLVAGGGGSYNIGRNQDNRSGVKPGDGFASITPVNTRPVLTVPADILTYADFDNCGTIVNFHASATGYPTPTIMYNHGPGFFSVGTTPVIVTAANSAGMVSDTFYVTVLDTIKPLIYCGPDIYILADSNDCNPIVFWDEPSASDNCSFTITSSHIAGDHFPIGSTTVSYTVTDSSGNSSSCSFNVTVKSKPFLAYPKVKTYQGNYNISCNGLSDGEASVIVQGGCAPYTYVWNTSPVQTTATATNLNAGTYMVTITDANGQIIVLSVTLTQPPILTANAGANVTVYNGYFPMSCATLNGSATGGTPYYTYLWSTGSSTVSTIVCPSLSTTYSLQVTDVNGCKATDDVVVCVVNVHCESGGNNNTIGSGTKVLVCHKTNNTTMQTICIAASAVPTHLAHGDKLGVCGTDLSCNIPDDKFHHTRIEIEDTSMAFNHLMAYPNPFSATITLEFTAQNSNMINLEIVDLNGLLVASIFKGNTTSGKNYRFELDGSTWENAVYMARLVSDQGVQHIKIVHTK